MNLPKVHSKIFWPVHLRHSPSGYVVGWNIRSFIVTVVTVIPNVEYGELEHMLSNFAHVYNINNNSSTKNNAKFDNNTASSITKNKNDVNYSNGENNNNNNNAKSVNNTPMPTNTATKTRTIHNQVGAPKILGLWITDESVMHGKVPDVHDVDIWVTLEQDCLKYPQIREICCYGYRYQSGSRWTSSQVIFYTPPKDYFYSMHPLELDLNTSMCNCSVPATELESTLRQLNCSREIEHVLLSMIATKQGGPDCRIGSDEVSVQPPTKDKSNLAHITNVRSRHHPKLKEGNLHTSHEWVESTLQDLTSEEEEEEGGPSHWLVLEYLIGCANRGLMVVILCLKFLCTIILYGFERTGLQQRTFTGQQLSHHLAVFKENPSSVKFLLTQSAAHETPISNMDPKNATIQKHTNPNPVSPNPVVPSPTTCTNHRASSPDISMTPPPDPATPTSPSSAYHSLPSSPTINSPSPNSSPPLPSTLSTQHPPFPQSKYNACTWSHELRIWNARWLTVNDILMGLLAGYFLYSYSDTVVDFLEKQQQMLTENVLRNLIEWLMGWPAGFKLNENLDRFLGRLFLYYIDKWTVVTGAVFSYIGVTVIHIVSMSGMFGISVMISVILDLAAFLTAHITCFYYISARFHHLELVVLSSLWKLFRGMKYNPLKHRIDSSDYEFDQLLLGTILLTLVVFLFPTTAVYYIFFTSLHLVLICFQGLGSLVLELLNYFPLYHLVIYFSHPELLPSGIRFAVDNSFVASHQTAQNNSSIKGSTNKPNNYNNIKSIADNHGNNIFNGTNTNQNDMTPKNTPINSPASSTSSATNNHTNNNNTNTTIVTNNTANVTNNTNSITFNTNNTNDSNMNTNNATASNNTTMKNISVTPNAGLPLTVNTKTDSMISGRAQLFSSTDSFPPVILDRKKNTKDSHFDLESPTAMYLRLESQPVLLSSLFFHLHHFISDILKTYTFPKLVKSFLTGAPWSQFQN